MKDYKAVTERLTKPLDEAIKDYQLCMKQEGLRVTVLYRAIFNRGDLDRYQVEKPKVELE